MGAMEGFERGQSQKRICILERSVGLQTGAQGKGWEFFMEGEKMGTAHEHLHLPWAFR